MIHVVSYDLHRNLLQNLLSVRHEILKAKTKLVCVILLLIKLDGYSRIKHLREDGTPVHSLFRLLGTYGVTDSATNSDKTVSNERNEILARNSKGSGIYNTLMHKSGKRQSVNKNPMKVVLCTPSIRQIWNMNTKKVKKGFIAFNVSPSSIHKDSNTIFNAV